jgi:hypothetical protein
MHWAKQRQAIGTKETMVFPEKKNQKTWLTGPKPAEKSRRSQKSFLLLFFKKEALSSTPP